MAQTIVVGGSIKVSLAYHMAIEGHASDVIVVEPDPAYEFAAAHAGRWHSPDVRIAGEYRDVPIWA